MRVWRMRTGISITLKPADRRRLKVLVRDRNAPHKHVWRAEIVLLSADGVGTNEIMRRTGKSKTCVWRWQERFMQAGYDSLLHDKTRPSRIRPLGSNITERVVMLTQTDPPAEATHWTSAMMAKVVDISASSVQRIWRTHGLQSHRVKHFKLSTDPQFVGKLRDIVGLYVKPALGQTRGTATPAGRHRGSERLTAAYVDKGWCGHDAQIQERLHLGRHQTRTATSICHRARDRPHQSRRSSRRCYFNSRAGDAANTILTAVRYNFRRILASLRLSCAKS